MCVCLCMSVHVSEQEGGRVSGLVMTLADGAESSDDR